MGGPGPGFCLLVLSLFRESMEEMRCKIKMTISLYLT